MSKQLDKRKIFQRMKSMTLDQFWQWMNVIHSDSYQLGMKHVKEAMEMHPRIYKPMIDEVLDKAKEIREEWDQIQEKEISDDELEHIRKMLRTKKG